MKRILFAAGMAAMALTLMAASDPFQLTVMGPRGGVMGGMVKNAPYSGEEVTTQDNTLGDGTKLHTETHTKVYRDSEGRTRRESEDMINIYDPVAGVTYVLNPKTMTCRQMKVTTVRTVTRDGVTTTSSATESAASGKALFYQNVIVTPDDPEAAARAEKMALDKAAAEQSAAQVKVEADVIGKIALDKVNAELDQVKADTQARMEIIKMADGAPDVGYALGEGTYSFKTAARATGKKEVLGTQVLEGVVADGVRTTSTLDTGAIGNDRPINVVSERWMSSDLKTVVMTKHNDPRTGEEVFRLTNVVRSEPDPALFQLPSGYTLAGEKRIVPR
jgi:hypothetical protein